VKETVDLAAGQRYVTSPPAGEEARGVASPFAQVCPKKRSGARMKRVGGGDAVLSPSDPDFATADVVEGKEPGLAPAQPIPIDDVEEEKIAGSVRRDAPEEPLDLLFREVLDRLLIAPSSALHSTVVLRTGGDSDAFPHLRSMARTHLRSVGRKAEDEDASQSAAT